MKSSLVDSLSITKDVYEVYITVRVRKEEKVKLT